MKNFSISRGILLGIGLLSATTLLGSSTPAQAQPYESRQVWVTENGRSVKKTVVVRKGEPYRPNNRDNRNKKWDKRDNKRNNWNNRNNNWNNRNNRNNNWNSRNNNVTLEGRVVRDLTGNGVIIRTPSGRDVRVTFVNGEPNNVNSNDTIRVVGTNQGSTFLARSVTMLRNR